MYVKRTFTGSLGISAYVEGHLLAQDIAGVIVSEYVHIMFVELQIFVQVWVMNMGGALQPSKGVQSRKEGASSKAHENKRRRL